MSDNFANLKAFALWTPFLGYRNQILGAFSALEELTGVANDPRNSFIFPEGVSDINCDGPSIAFSNFKNFQEFRRNIFGLLDTYMQNNNCIPKIFITVYNMTSVANPKKNVDMLCRAVKEYYAEHKLGNIFTAVLTSKLHKYKYVDLINIPKHLMTFSGRIRLLQNKKLRKKTLITVGTINNFNQNLVKKKQKDLLTTLKKYENDMDTQSAVKKIQDFIAAKKKVVFCLGGRVEGNEIIFDIAYSKKLYNLAKTLTQCGFGVVFVNGPRTPNDVTDFLYEKSLEDPLIVFQNSKGIASSDEERQSKNWRIYSGNHEQDFIKLQKIGNIYPGIIGFDNTLVVHSADSYSSCETTSAAIPTAISKGLHIDPQIRYDCLNLFDLLCPKYAIDFDEFVYFARNMKIEPNDLRPQILSSPLRVFAETVVNHINKMPTKNDLVD